MIRFLFHTHNPPHHLFYIFPFSLHPNTFFFIPFNQIFFSSFFSPIPIVTAHTQSNIFFFSLSFLLSHLSLTPNHIFFLSFSSPIPIQSNPQLSSTPSSKTLKHHSHPRHKSHNIAHTFTENPTTSLTPSPKTP